MIDQINAETEEENKKEEPKAEELKDKEQILEKNKQTAEKIKQTKTVISMDAPDRSSGSGLCSSKNLFSGKGSGLDDLWKESEKKTETKKSSSYSWGSSSSSYYSSNQLSEKERQMERNKKQMGAELKHHIKNELGADTMVDEMYSVFELHERAAREKQERHYESLEQKEKEIRGLFKKKSKMSASLFALIQTIKRF